MNHLNHDRQAKAEEHLRKAGYAAGGAIHSDAAQDKREIAGMIHRHEHHDHKGEPLTKFRRGGHVHGKEAEPRLDKRARGGRTNHKGKPTQVNVIVQSGNEAERQMAAQKGMQAGAQMAAAHMAAAAHPPMPPPGAGPPMPPRPMGPPQAGPPGGMAMKPPGMMRRGGRLHAGAGSGLGRLEKARDAHERG